MLFFEMQMLKHLHAIKNTITFVTCLKDQEHML
jgi:hypothetical protein